MPLNPRDIIHNYRDACQFGIEHYNPSLNSGKLRLKSESASTHMQAYWISFLTPFASLAGETD